ncbi:hypothetical protein NL676_005825 [Syzygium grande]|nr:hypothetical protein NL676_005825 [Syzygium grande]
MADGEMLTVRCSARGSRRCFSSVGPSQINQQNKENDSDGAKMQGGREAGRMKTRVLAGGELPVTQDNGNWRLRRGRQLHRGAVGTGVRRSASSRNRKQSSNVIRVETAMRAIAGRSVRGSSSGFAVQAAWSRSRRLGSS